MISRPAWSESHEGGLNPARQRRQPENNTQRLEGRRLTLCSLHWGFQCALICANLSLCLAQPLPTNPTPFLDLLADKLIPDVSLCHAPCLLSNLAFSQSPTIPTTLMALHNPNGVLTSSSPPFFLGYPVLVNLLCLFRTPHFFEFV